MWHDVGVASSELFAFCFSDCKAQVNTKQCQKQTEATDRILPELVSDMDRCEGKTLCCGGDHKKDAPHEAGQPK